MKYFIILILVSLFSLNVFGMEEMLAVSINKNVLLSNIQDAIDDLENLADNISSEDFSAKLYHYSTFSTPNTDQPYRGIILIIIHYSLSTDKDLYLKLLANDDRFSLLWISPSGPSPSPSVTGNN